MTVTEKVAYIQGMFDGMGLDKSESKEAKILAEVLDVLKEVGEELEDLDETLDDFGEELDAVSDDLSDLEDTVYGDDGDEDECGCGCGHDHDEEDDLIEASCPNCGEDLYIDQSILEAGEIDCPACGQKFALSIEDDEDDEEDE